MSKRSQELFETFFAVLLILGVFLVTVTDGSAAPAGGQSIEERVTTNRWFCEFTGGEFSQTGWTVPGQQPGTMDSTAISTCDYGNGDVTTCRDTETSHTCEDSVKTPPRGRGETDQPDDAVQDDAAPSDPRVPPTVTPVPDARG